MVFIISCCLPSSSIATRRAWTAVGRLFPPTIRFFHTALIKYGRDKTTSAFFANVSKKNKMVFARRRISPVSQWISAVSEESIRQLLTTILIVLCTRARFYIPGITPLKISALKFWKIEVSFWLWSCSRIAVECFLCCSKRIWNVTKVSETLNIKIQAICN